MPVFGFAVDHDSGATDFVVAAGGTLEHAHANVAARFEGYAVTIEPVDLAEMLGNQYNDVGILTTESGGPCAVQDSRPMSEFFTEEEDRRLAELRAETDSEGGQLE